jgi:uncharacterized protein (DUF934 family)
MPTLIKDRRIVDDDPWVIVDDQDPVLQAAPGGRRLIYPAVSFGEHRPLLDPRETALGVWLEGEHEPDVVAPFISELDLIAVRFGAMNDGRGLSLAALLRGRYGYRRELRAFGVVHEDLLHYMRRCGFDSFLIPDGRDPQIALAVCRGMSDYYQGSVIQPVPAFRRVHRGSIA